MRTANRTRQVARAYREDKPYPPADAGRAIDGTTIYPVFAWTDYSDRVYVAFAREEDVYAASFDRGDLTRLRNMGPAETMAFRCDPTLTEGLRVAMTRLRVIPSSWYKEE